MCPKDGVEMLERERCYFPRYKATLDYYVCPKCGMCIPKNPPIRYYI